MKYFKEIGFYKLCHLKNLSYHNLFIKLYITYEKRRFIFLIVDDILCK